jgi:hypothetical protein
MRERIADADDRITHWMTHTNAGVITGLLVVFALVVLVAALVT